MKLIAEKEQQRIVDNLISKLIDTEILEQRILLWNSLKEQYRKYRYIVPISQMNEIMIPNKDK
jgi:hypothetical protein